jgi:predicted aspartyl protease
MSKQPHIPIKHDYPGRVKRISSQVEVISIDDPSKHNVYTGIWDTGAEITMITPRIFNELGLTQIDETPICGVNSTIVKAPVVLVTLNLENKITAPSFRVVVSDMYGADMLLGIDLIQNGDLAISTHGGKTLFTFVWPPFPNKTDLADKANAVNNSKKKR